MQAQLKQEKPEKATPKNAKPKKKKEPNAMYAGAEFQNSPTPENLPIPIFASTPSRTPLSRSLDSRPIMNFREGVSNPNLAAFQDNQGMIFNMDEEDTRKMMSESIKNMLKINSKNDVDKS